MSVLAQRAHNSPAQTQITTATDVDQLTTVLAEPLRAFTQAVEHQLLAALVKHLCVCVARW
jgi:hypothetical protein